jgi:hypothetical protein
MQLQQGNLLIRLALFVADGRCGSSDADPQHEQDGLPHCLESSNAALLFPQIIYFPFKETLLLSIMPAGLVAINAIQCERCIAGSLLVYNSIFCSSCFISG